MDPKFRRWRLLTNETKRLFKREVNTLASFWIKGVTTGLLFLSLLAMSVLFGELSIWVTNSFESARATGAALDLLSWLCLAADILWLSNRIAPWVTPAKRWLASRNQKRK
ncbi:MAG: hypothetical protein A2580_11705 [Hydrogenophilales bacterium RIFOXYD1_FULL_62_11]|nr:MAG: hypothetical protein A2580_11705 [Hydrogenophilales bacterium RIFOXYD1_FULL_62_11]